VPPWVCSAYVLLIFALGSAVITSSAATVAASAFAFGYPWLALGVLTVLGGRVA